MAKRITNQIDEKPAGINSGIEERQLRNSAVKALNGIRTVETSMVKNGKKLYKMQIGSSQVLTTNPARWEEYARKNKYK